MPSFKKLSPFLAFAILISSSSAFAGAVKTDAVVGMFGFDWLNNPRRRNAPRSRRKPQPSSKPATMPRRETPVRFRGNADYYKCQVSEKSEIMIYKTKARAPKNWRS
jgi:hypothetical protein